ncbi:hypothetical protein M9Y10_016797 [Tritrichomonas musculus]|uniref:Ubiquitin-like domain-containing protein n=1 Tax=Tritrichomonas musculus TaxID=1915356 RepID=A0ABR2HX68_9EUKA
MTTSLAFLKAGLEKKIEINDIDNDVTFDELSNTIMGKLSELHVAPNSAGQIRFIYSGKILNPKDNVGSIRNPDIEPPYTLQILIRPEISPNQAQDSQPVEVNEKKGSCCYLI